jgi:hypothetical protein
VVKVKPAFAGEGRYFVRVPPGTNADDFTPEKPSFVSHERLDLNNVAEDGIEAEERAEMFLKFLQEQDDGYEGEFDGEAYKFNNLSAYNETSVLFLGCVGVTKLVLL